MTIIHGIPMSFYYEWNGVKVYEYYIEVYPGKFQQFLYMDSTEKY